MDEIEMGVETRAIARGKPAEFGQEIVKRRYRLTAARVDLKNKVVLDFGCGNGAQTIEFLHSDCRIVAVDIDYSNLKTLANYLLEQRIDKVLTVQYDGLYLPVSTESVDVVVSYEVIEHVDDESQALREIYRVLRSDGYLILSVPNKGWLFETHGANVPLLPWNRVPFISWLPRGIHRRLARARIYRKRDIVELLTAHSFDVQQTQYITAPMDVVRYSWLKKFLRSTIFVGDTTPLTFLSTSILVHCQKK